MFVITNVITFRFLVNLVRVKKQSVIEMICKFIYVKKRLALLKIFFPLGMTWNDFKQILSTLKRK